MSDMDLERLFIAFALPSELRSQLTMASKLVREKTIGAKVVKNENLHVTLRFLGDRNPKEKNEIAKLLKSLESHWTDRFTLTFDRFTFFRSGHDATLVATFLGNDAICHFVKTVNGRLDKYGMPPEKRAWKPHVTIARRVNANSFDLKQLPLPAHIPFTIDTLTLFRSQFTTSGMLYTPQQSIYVSDNTK